MAARRFPQPDVSFQARTMTTTGPPAFDRVVLQGLARWPDVPDAFGWLRLDRRGRWQLRNPARGAFEGIGNAALRAFIGRNYAADAGGRWFFQNGPQRVFVQLAYTPFVVRLAGGTLLDQCDREFEVRTEYLDDEGSVVLESSRGIALLDQHDLAHYAEGLENRLSRLPVLARADVARRFGFDPDPGPVAKRRRMHAADSPGSGIG
ncbi:MAG: hypothetical protein A3I63_06080 [Betaproteobacteria bacterium RIFCSPLOWO2_02_FULL_66_14]|nr:MAG: hypothetical protein A3I63_06080 [Betaproteobacteria bacterium RIFCSPLOWO2_02_FULL_66_14]